MKVLYVSGSCLTKNTSANMSHNSFIKGLLENGADIDILMPTDSWGEKDKALPRWENANYIEFDPYPFSEKIRHKFIIKENQSASRTNERDNVIAEKNIIKSLKSVIRSIVKKIFYILFPRDDIYPLDKQWIKRAKKYKCNKKYDYIISNSSPASSHKLVDELLLKGNVSCNRWIQIWEDPWFFDLYGGHSEKIREEEHYLLQKAEEIVYVSPLTLMYQKIYFPDCAKKMKEVPLPFLEYENVNNIKEIEKGSFGYFGDYYSHTRNLTPFYEALTETGYKGFIYGDSDIVLNKTQTVEVSGRVTLDKLSEIQSKTNVLVHLCNIKGGQIPGKIYHYSATNKPILFIVDGSEEEKAILVKHFSKFDRYYFAENVKEEIIKVMNQIITENREFKKVDMFEPNNVVRQLLR